MIKTKHILITCMTLLIGAFWYIMWDAYDKQNSLMFPTVTGVTVVSSNQRYQLIISAEASAPIKCDRFIAHYVTAMSESNVSDTIVIENGTIMPLALTINAPNIAPPPSKYKLLFALPPGMAPGHWWYRSRIIYLCSVWPGFVTMRAFEMEKMGFDLPPASDTASK